MARRSAQTRQLELPMLPLPSEPRAAFNDPAFVGNKQLPIHRWVPWIAGFSQDFVQGALETYLRLPGTVLDPFSGVGTTLVEAIAQGHQAIGFEINPYAVLASETKIMAHRIPVETLNEEIAHFKAAYHSRITDHVLPQSQPPPGFRTRLPFYSPAVLYKVLTVQDLIADVADPSVKTAFRLAFAATMVRYSNYSYEPSLGTRSSSGKDDIADFSVGQTIIEKLNEMAEDIVWLKHNLPRVSESTARVIHDSFFNYQSHLSPASVDLIITSPPYLNNYHYIRNTRPHLYWLGYAEKPADFKVLEEANFGKFWQTVREQPIIPLTFSLPNSDMQERLDALQGVNPEKGTYGGRGWANYAASYFNDAFRFVSAVKDVLKPGGTALVVIGNSILQGILIPTDQYLGQIASTVGLELVNIEVLRATRVGSSIIQSDVRVAKAGASQRLYEAVVELRKPKS